MAQLHRLRRTGARLMGLFDRLTARDRQLAATRYAGRTSASDEAAAKRRAAHRARVARDGDAAGQKFPRRLFRGD
ncbi:hypothetical protein [Streptomyces griseosporeus]|uniref:hypothetical protein n=1 Tax=Streptomyces griseosporeus TaxID=1910 RepID=UPI0036FC8EE8